MIQSNNKLSMILWHKHSRICQQCTRRFYKDGWKKQQSNL